MACYVRIGKNVDTEELIEVPAEEDGTMLLSSVSAQFPNAVGLRYKTESGAWRGLRSEGNVIDSPLEGWGDSEYYVVTKKVLKRVAGDDDSGPIGKFSKMTDEEILSDLIISGLPYSTTEGELRKHFKSFGELDMLEVKYDNSRKCRGFAFLRYKTVEAVEAAFNGTHIISKRRCHLRYSKRSHGHQEDQDDIPFRLFIGRLPAGTTAEELQEYFGKYGVLKDVYVPSPFRGYGFVLFSSETIANKVLNETHVLKGNFLNVSNATEKKMDGMNGPPNPGFGNMQGGMQTNLHQMGSMQNNRSSAMNTMLSWMQGKLQTQNGGQTLGPRFGYGYQGNGNYSNLGHFRPAK